MEVACLPFLKQRHEKFTGRETWTLSPLLPSDALAPGPAPGPAVPRGVGRREAGSRVRVPPTHCGASSCHGDREGLEATLGPAMEKGTESPPALLLPPPSFPLRCPCSIQGSERVERWHMAWCSGPGPGFCSRCSAWSGMLPTEALLTKLPGDHGGPGFSPA